MCHAEKREKTPHFHIFGAREGMHSNVTGNKRIKKIKTGKLVDGNVAGVEKTINETDQISLAYTGGYQDGKPEKSMQLRSTGGDSLSIFPGDESFIFRFV